MTVTRKKHLVKFETEHFINTTLIRLSQIQAILLSEDDFQSFHRIVIRMFGDEITAKTANYIYVNYKSFDERNDDYMKLEKIWNDYLEEQELWHSVVRGESFSISPKQAVPG